MRLKRIARRILEPFRSTRKLILNEAVNLEKQVIFIAIPKTGTTSIRDQIRAEGDALIPNPHLSIMQVRDALYAYFLRLSMKQCDKFPTEQVPTDAQVRLLTAQAFNSCFKFSSVRNPWGRAVSLYFRREGVQVRDEMSFDDFCERLLHASDTCRQPTLHKNQFDWLCDESGDLLVDYVYKLEDFRDALSEIEKRTDGRIRIKYVEYNTNRHSPGDYRTLYSARARNLIAKRFEKDIDYFKYTF
jgi:hypothetical protein